MKRKIVIFILFYLIVLSFEYYRDFHIEVNEGNGFQPVLLRSEKSVELMERKYGKKNVRRIYLQSDSYLTRFSPSERKSEIISTLEYFTIDELTTTLTQITTDNPDVCQISELGPSPESREISMVTINVHGEALETNYPGILYIANMHGDETVGVPMLAKFIDFMCNNYGIDDTVTEILDNTVIYVVPTMNPDGYTARERENSFTSDLNRNFEDQFVGQITTAQPETEIIYNLMAQKKHVVIDANFHGGTVVASYPFDGNPDLFGYANEDEVEEFEGIESLSPDDAFLSYAAATYANENSVMLANTDFTNGITNGAKWYPLYGGLQDYGYVFHNIMPICVELSYEKDPPQAELQQHYNDNVNSLLEFSKLAYRVGIRGVVKDRDNNTLGDAMINVVGIDKEMRSLADGRYYRLLKPGATYEVKVWSPGYDRETISVELPENQEFQVTLDFHLHRNFWAKYLFPIIGLSIACCAVLTTIFVFLVILVVGAVFSYGRILKSLKIVKKGEGSYKQIPTKDDDTKEPLLDDDNVV